MEQKEETLEFWHEINEKGDCFWHLTKPHEYLVKYFDQYKNGKQDPKVLIPLIGKTVDAKWLYDQGCHVTGVDVSELPIKQLFTQDNIAYTRNQSEFPEFVLFQNDDRRIRVFSGDFYRFRTEVAKGQFDLIWDRAAFTAINMRDREKYAEVLEKVLSPTGSILLVGLDYDHSKYEGPPHFVTKEHMDSLFGKKFHVSRLDHREVIDQWHHKNWGLDWLEESIYLLKKK